MNAFATPVIRQVARMLFPATRAATTAVLLSNGSLFIAPNNMRYRSSSVNRKMHDRTGNKGYANLQDGVVFPDPKPSDWRDNMTVCIAAICDKDQTIVAAVDRMLSLPFTTADSIGFKVSMLGSGWFALWSADDITDVEPILDAARAIVHGAPNEVLLVEGAFMAAYQRVRSLRAESQILGVYNFTMDRFAKDGLQAFGQEKHYELCRDIESIKLSCDFLVAGFDAHRKPHIIYVDSSGQPKRMTRVGFWATGSGAQSALSSLFYHRYVSLFPLPKALYHVCESKFMAEFSLGVGRDTTLFCLTSDDDFRILGLDKIETIRKQWSRKGRPRVPRGIEDLIAKLDWIVVPKPQAPPQPTIPILPTLPPFPKGNGEPTKA